MPFGREPLTNLRKSIRADIATRLPGSDPYVRRSPFGVLADVLAKLQDDQNGYLDWQSRMAVPFTAEAEFNVAWSSLRGAYLKSPTPARGTATIAGGTEGATIDVDATLTRADNIVYRVTVGDTVATDGSATISLEATMAGALADCTPGTPLTFAPLLPDIPTIASVVTLTGGTDLETDASLRARALQLWRAPPQGGDLDDYVSWALAVPQVTRAWTAGSSVMGAGTVSVYFMCDDDAHPEGVPIGVNGVSRYENRTIHVAQGDQLDVADALFLKRPVTALVYGVGPVAVPLDLMLAEVPNDSTIRNGIALALNAFLLREASPGGVVLADLSAGGTVFVSHLWDAIAAVPGLDHFVPLAPVADVVVAQGSISVPGLVTYIG